MVDGMIFDWINKTPMTETIFDEICKTICVVLALCFIGFVGYMTYKLENLYRRKYEQK